MERKRVKHEHFKQKNAFTSMTNQTVGIARRRKKNLHHTEICRRNNRKREREEFYR